MSVIVDVLVVGWPACGLTTVLVCQGQCGLTPAAGGVRILGEAFHRAAHGVAKPTVGCSTWAPRT